MESMTTFPITAPPLPGSPSKNRTSGEMSARQIMHRRDLITGGAAQDSDPANKHVIRADLLGEGIGRFHLGIQIVSSRPRWPPRIGNGVGLPGRQAGNRPTCDQGATRGGIAIVEGQGQVLELARAAAYHFRAQRDRCSGLWRGRAWEQE